MPWRRRSIAIWRRLPTAGSRSWTTAALSGRTAGIPCAESRRRQTRPLSRLQRLRQETRWACISTSTATASFRCRSWPCCPSRTDFTGGEFVMTEQRPRMQSRPIVLPLGIGDAAIIGTGSAAVQGGAGYYRVNLKHAISRVRDGERVAWTCCCTTRPERRLRRRPGAFPGQVDLQGGPRHFRQRGRPGGVAPGAQPLQQVGQMPQGRGAFMHRHRKLPGYASISLRMACRDTPAISATSSGRPGPARLDQPGVGQGAAYIVQRCRPRPRRWAPRA